MKVRRVLTSGIVTLLLAGAAQAQTTSLLTGTSWNAATWSNGVPGTNSDVVIGLQLPLGFAYDVADTQVRSLTIDAGVTPVFRQATGLLATDSLIVGNTNSGTYQLSGGSLVVHGGTGSHLIIGAGAGGVGRFELSGTGSVTANAIHVGGGTSGGGAASGTFVQTGGTVNVTAVGDLIVGDTSGTSGRYEMQGGALTAKNLYVAHSGSNPAGDNRAFIQTGGTVTFTNNLSLGGFYGGTSAPAGSYTLSGSGVLNTTNVWVGLSGSGTFNQLGGTHSSDSLMVAAAQSGSTGAYNISGGTLTAKGLYLGDVNGNGGNGTLTQTAGTVNVTEGLIVDKGAGSLGKYVMSSGSLTATGSGATALLVLGEFQQTGGTVTVNGTGEDARLHNLGTYQLGGGTIGGTGKFINEGTTTLSGGTSTISLPVENFGDFEAVDASVVYNGLFQNSGEYVSGGTSTQTFNGGFENLSGGYLAASEPGEVFKIGGALTINSADSSLWNTETAILHFFKGTGNVSGEHSLLYAGLDVGAFVDGFEDNFAWAELIIEAGNALATSDIDGRALYAEKLTFGSTVLSEIIDQVGDFSGDLTIYYDPAKNPELQGQTIAFGSGTGSVAPVAPVPEPSALLLAGVGAIALSFRRRRRAA